MGSKIIHVPQGYGAQLLKSTEKLNIQGLYTEGISSCNIIAYVSDDRLFLVHVDFQTWPILVNKIRKCINSLNNQHGEVVLIFRSPIGELLRDFILGYFRETMPSQRVTQKLLTHDHRGVYLSFREAQSQFNPNISLLKERPDELIHHPQERQFLSVQKIEQIVGLRARVATQQYREKNIFIFDGAVWAFLGQPELEIDDSHSHTKEEMCVISGNFSDQKTYVMILACLQKLMENIRTMGGGMSDAMSEQDIALSVAPYLEDYLNRYDHELSFKSNLKNILDNEFTNQLPYSEADNDFKGEIKRLLRQSKQLFQDVDALVQLYKKTSVKSEFKKQFVSEYETISRHYGERKYYKDLEERYLASRNEALTDVATAIKTYKDGNYQEAATLFKKAVQDLTYVCLRYDPNLATAYYNYGRSLFYSERYQESKDVLETCLSLRTTAHSPNQALIDKAQKALSECTKKLTLTPAFGALALGRGGSLAVTTTTPSQVVEPNPTTRQPAHP